MLFKTSFVVDLHLIAINRDERFSYGIDIRTPIVRSKLNQIYAFILYTNTIVERIANHISEVEFHIVYLQNSGGGGVYSIHNINYITSVQHNAI